MTRLRPRALGGVLLVLLLTACGAGAPGPARPGAGPSGAAAPAGGRHALQVVLVGSQLLVGSQRFPVGVLDHDTPVTDAAVHVRAFTSRDGSERLGSEADAPFRGEGLEGRGLYVAWLQLDSPGQWLAEISVGLTDRTRRSVAIAFRVLTHGSVPAAGEAAPRSHNLTVNDVPDASYIDSGVPPDDMHTISIADAIAQHRPVLVVFATPAFCSSATCGPQVHAVQQLEPLYRDRLTFVHVEIYQHFKPDPARRELSPTVLEWHLVTEPWVFLIDTAGVISAAFEGAAAADELTQAVDRLLAGG